MKGNLRVKTGAIICCLLPLLSGCIASNTPGDLTFRSAREVDWRDQAEMPGAKGLKGGEKGFKPLIKVEFTSGTNLLNFARTNSYTVLGEAFFCARPDDYVRLSFVDVYSRGARVDGLERGETEADAAQGGATYYIFLNVAGLARPSDIPPQKAFDLRQHAEDVCFYVRGGNVTGSGYKSNTVVVPKEAIAAALRDSSAPR